MTRTARKMRNTAHVITRNPATLTDADMSDLRMAREYLNALLEGESLDPGEVYLRAFKDTPEYQFSNEEAAA